VFSCAECKKPIERYEYLDIGGKIGWCSLPCIEVSKKTTRDRLRQRRLDMFLIVYSRLPYSEEELMGVHLDV
jgi:hypothetical protein